MDELKPCPFCGEEGHISASSDGYGVQCWNRLCISLQLEELPSEAEAIEAWNTRAERTCHRFWTGAEMVCSRCAHQLNNATANYCPTCGAKVVDE